MKTQIINSLTQEKQIKEMTSEEETLHNELIKATKVSEDNFDLKQEQRKEKKTSGRQKLKDLGLDDDEINELMGE